MMWQQQFVQTKRGVFEIFVAGEGEPLCVTHLYSAFNANGNHFANMFVPFFKVYLVNLRGCGNSTDDTTVYDYSMNHTVADLESIRAALQLDEWAFAGHSTGGMLALSYAIQSPAHLSFIVGGGLCASRDYMYDPASIYCRENPHNASLKEIFALLKDPTATLAQRQAVSKEWMYMSLFQESSYAQLTQQPNSGKTVGKRLDYFSYEELPTFDLRPQLPTVETKAYIYGGVHDAQCPYTYAVEAAHLLPNATLTTFHKSNHFPFDEEPDAFAQFVQTIGLEVKR